MTKSNRIRLWAAGIALAVALLFCGVGFWVLDAAFGIKIYGDELDVQLAKAKELGVATEASDLNSNEIPLDQDASVELLEIFNGVQEQRASVTAARNRIDQDSKIRPELRSQALSNEIMVSHAKLLDAADQAVKKPGFHMAREWNRGPWLPLPEYSGFMRIGRMYGFRAGWNFRTGDWKGGIRDLKALAVWRDYSNQEPLLMSMIVGYAIDVIWLRAIENAISVSIDNPNRLNELEQILSENRFKPDIKLAFQTTPIVAATCARNIRPMQQFRLLFLGRTRFDFQREPKQLVTSGIPGSVLGRNMLKSFLEFWNEQQEFMDLNSDPLVVLSHLESERKKATAEKSLSADFIRAMTASIEQVNLSALRHEATLRSAEGLLAVNQFNQKHNRMPVSLAEASFKQLDPYTNQPMKLIVHHDSIKVYCVGPNLKDDLGKWRGSPNSQGFRGPELDIGTCYPSREPSPVR